MIRQIRRLTRAVALAGPEARAIAVYAEPTAPDRYTVGGEEPRSGESSPPSQLQAAEEQGVEGVACVDDAARAVVLFCTLWRRFGDAQARSHALGLLRFLGYMQDQDGRFTNFVLDWTGRKNREGSTSYTGGPQWQARALHALACGVATFGTGEWSERFDLCVRWIDDAMPYLDVRAVCVLAALEHWQATRSSDSADRAVSWSEEIAAHRHGKQLLNATGVQSIHLWGHLQEAALAETGRLFDLPILVQRSRASAEGLLLPAVARRFASERVLPFDVSCVVSGLATLARATRDVRYARAASEARAWFDGRNSAGRPVYDRGLGVVYDGIDAGRVSRNSGAESNIEGALALLC